MTAQHDRGIAAGVTRAPQRGRVVHVAEAGFAALVVSAFVIVAAALLILAITMYIAGARATRSPCPHCGRPARRLRGLCRSCAKPLTG